MLSPRLLAQVAIACFAVFNIIFLFAACPLGLAPDEAHYWDWSRQLDWSYYSKGPLVALMIRGSCELFGHTMPAVRLPAVACNSLLLLALYELSARTFRNERLALVTILLAMTLPPLTVGAVMMTIDAPYLYAWSWACVFAQRAVETQRMRDWLLAGVMSLVGVLAKYTMLLFPVCVGFYLLSDSARRVQLRGVGFWLMTGCALLGMLPIGIWNATHDWLGVRHVFNQAGLTSNTTFDPSGLPDFLVGQFAVLLGYWLFAWVVAMMQFRPWRNSNANLAILWWLSVPVWLLFAVTSLKTKGQPNWPAAAYVTGFILAVAWVVQQVHSPPSPYRLFAKVCLIGVIVLGLGLSCCARWPHTLRVVLADLAPAPTRDKIAPVRQLDPTCRLEGWQQLAKIVDDLRAKIQAEEGRGPLIAGMTWTVPGELAFYCQGHPTVYCFGPIVGERFSQYDLWRPNPIRDAQVFAGRTFVYVGEAIPDAQQVFDRVDPPVEVIASDGGIPVAEWKVWVLHGFRGFPANTNEMRHPSY